MKKTAIVAALLCSTFIVAGIHAQAQSEDGNYENNVQSGVNDNKNDLTEDPKGKNEIKEATEHDMLNDQKEVVNNHEDLIGKDIANDEKEFSETHSASLKESNGLNELTDKDMIKDEKGIKDDKNTNGGK